MKLFPRFFLEGEGGDGGSNGSNGGGGASGGSTLLGGAAGGSSGAGQGDGSKAGSGASGGTGAGDGGSPGAWDFRSSLDDKGNFRPGWDANLPDDLKASAAALAKYPNPLELMRGHVNASKLIGQKTALKAPAPDAKPEEVAKFNAQIREVLGVPAKAEEYKLTKPDNLPQGLSWDEAKVGDWQKFFHDANIPPAVADKIVAKQAAEIASQAEAGKGKLDQWVKSQEAELRKEWGADFDANLGLAAKAASIAGFDLNDSELGNNAKFVQAMLTVSRFISPDKLVGDDKVTAMNGAAQAEDIRRNPNNPWHKAFMGQEGEARQREAAGVMARLQGVKVSWS